MNTKLHAVSDANGRPLSFFMTAGQVSDYTGAAALLDDLPKARWLLGDRGYDADWFRDALQEKGIKACIPGRKSRSKPIKYDKRRYRSRNRIEIMFGRLKPVLSLSKGTGAVSLLAMTAARRSSSPPSRSRPPSSSGYDQ
jgi:transposase